MVWKAGSEYSSLAKGRGGDSNMLSNLVFGFQTTKLVMKLYYMAWSNSENEANILACTWIQWVALIVAIVGVL